MQQQFHFLIFALNKSSSMNSYKLAILAYFTITILFVSCSNSTKDDGSKVEQNEAGDSLKNGKAIQTPKPGSINGDTINLSGKFVLFYGPENELADSISKNFKELSNVIIDSLTRTGDLNVAYTSVSNFKVYSKNGSPMIISTEGFIEKTGILVMDGLQPPAIIKGVKPASDYHALIKKYFFRP